MIIKMPEMLLVQTSDWFKDQLARAKGEGTVATQ